MSDRTLALFPKQLDFVRDHNRYPAAIGGIGSGKTFVGAAKTVSRMGRRELGLVLAPTYKMLRDSTQRTLFDMLGSLNVPFKFNKSDNHLVLPHSGHEILFRSLDDPDNLRGPNAAYAWIDEAGYVSVKAWRVVKGRVRVGNRQQLWLTTTPKGRNWIWEEWVNEPTNRHRMYRFRTVENTTLDADFAETLGFTGKYAEQELDGEFVTFDGLVYQQFDRDQHVKRVDTRGWAKIQGVDVGARNPTVVLTIYFSPGGRVHVGSEAYQRNLSSSAILSMVGGEFDEHQPDDVFIDPSALAYISDLEYEGVPVVKANNDIRTGIQTVNSLFNGEFTVDPSCVHTISEFESYQYPEEGKANDDKPIKQNDHCMDALRYGVMGYLRGDNRQGEADALDAYLSRQLAGVA